jgi:GNAT superfamily N-acetyltransferase
VRLTGGTERLSHIGEVTVHPVSEDRIDDWVRFFDHDAFAGNPGWASCYCLEPHLPAMEENLELERPWREIRGTMVERLRTGGTFGYLAYVDGTPAGWINVSPRSEYGLYRNVDPDGPEPASVIGVSCFVIAPPYRRHGVAASLLDRVIADAADRGAKFVEGYPHNAPEDDDAGHFRGPRHLYDARLRARRLMNPYHWAARSPATLCRRADAFHGGVRFRTAVISFGCTVIPPIVVLGPSKRIVLVGRRSAPSGCRRGGHSRCVVLARWCELGPSRPCGWAVNLRVFSELAPIN